MGERVTAVELATCRKCGEAKPPSGFSDFERGRRECKACRHRRTHASLKIGPRQTADSIERDVPWDGQWPAQVRRPYQVVCLQAGHVMRRVRLTEFQAARIVIVGFRALHLPTKCDVCNGWLLLESDEDGQIGGGIQAHTVTGGYWWPESAA